MNIEIKIKLNDVEMTMDEARTLYNELHKLFGMKRVAAPAPSIFREIDNGYPSPAAKWRSIGWTEAILMTCGAR